MNTQIIKIRKDKPYNVRLNESLVKEVKEKEQLSPQKILDNYYLSYLAESSKKETSVDELEGL